MSVVTFVKYSRHKTAIIVQRITFSVFFKFHIFSFVIVIKNDKKAGTYFVFAFFCKTNYTKLIFDRKQSQELKFVHLI